jgi:hypothetical protein
MKQVIAATLLAAVVSVAGAAQSPGSMPDAGTMGQMGRMDAAAVNATYTGCLEAGDASGTYRLTRAHRASGKSMQEQAMAPGMKGDGMMAPASNLSVSSTSVDLRKHVGRKVSVTGSAATVHEESMDMKAGNTSTFTIKTLKVLAASCS